MPSPLSPRLSLVVGLLGFSFIGVLVTNCQERPDQQRFGQPLSPRDLAGIRSDEELLRRVVLELERRCLVDRQQIPRLSLPAQHLLVLHRYEPRLGVDGFVTADGNFLGQTSTVADAYQAIGAPALTTYLRSTMGDTHSTPAALRAGWMRLWNPSQSLDLQIRYLKAHLDEILAR